MKRRILLGITLSALLLGAQTKAAMAAEQQTEESGTADSAAQTADEEETAYEAAVSSMAVQTIAAADNALGKRLMAKLAETQSNVFISPYSIASALSMLGHCSEEGAHIEELRAFLGYDELTEEEILEGQQMLMNVLRPEYGLDDLTKEEKEELHIGSVEIANALLVDDELKLLMSFDELTRLLAAYQAETGTGPLETEQMKDEINDWVREKTHGMIDSLLQEPLSEDTAMLLINTVYFRQNWASLFQESATDRQTFYGTDGETTVSMMHQQGTFAYAEDEEYQIICLPYSDAYDMYVYLPKDAETCSEWKDAEYLTALADRKSPYEESADSEDGYEYREIALSMPKFKLEYTVELKELLQEMGLSSIFGGCRYDRISDQELAVSEILHKTALNNDENGTEAAAVTSIMAKFTSFIGEEPIEVTIDRPFYFTVTHRELGLNLFEGCVMNPEEE